MIWLFERGQEALRIETRCDNDAREYVATTYWPDGRSETERFTSVAAFRARLGALERQLAAEQWTQIGSPMLLSEGWRLGKTDPSAT